LSKRIIVTGILFLLIFAGFIAVTQEFDRGIPDVPLLTFDIYDYQPDLETAYEDEEYEEYEEEIPEIIRPVRWFRSNAGGMAIEEIFSRFVALRNEYSLSIDSVRVDDMPDYIRPFHNTDFSAEIRVLYRNGEVFRTQWILRDSNMTTRVNAVLMLPPQQETEDNISPNENGYENAEPSVINGVRPIDYHLRYIITNRKTGFIEIFNENSFIVTEYRFSDFSGITKIEHEYNINVIISSAHLLWNEETNQFDLNYRDFYRYTRSMTLRAMERTFYRDTLINDIPVRITFPRHTLDALGDESFIGQRLNVFPVFFGDIFAYIHSTIVFENDERGRTLRKTLFDDEDESVWVITNIWDNDRILTMIKVRGDTELRAEFEYDSAGNLIAERNYRDGAIERVVRMENNTEIEDLYMNNVLVLRAVWEDGRKISETRMR